MKLLWVLLVVVFGCREKQKESDGDTQYQKEIIPSSFNESFKSLSAIIPKADETSTADMVFIDGGEFTMGTDKLDTWPSERPAHQVSVDGFWMDTREVTNRQYREFVEATGYVTVAAREVDWEEMKKQLPPGTPKPDLEVLKPGALVFNPPSRVYNLQDFSQWWQWVIGADWQHPEGPESNIEGMDDHPVVFVAYEDALAYAKWIGKRLPTEAEWEYAARGGLASARFVWGNSPEDSDTIGLANIWQGTFPTDNTLNDGFSATAPVASFVPNNFGLYDMAGNVWEWCSDWYHFDAYKIRVAEYGSDHVFDNPKGSDKPWDPNEPYALKRMTKGGSFLCHFSYCSSYRPSARNGTAYDTGMSHVGFRLVYNN